MIHEKRTQPPDGARLQGHDPGLAPAKSRRPLADRPLYEEAILATTRPINYSNKAPGRVGAPESGHKPPKR